MNQSLPKKYEDAESISLTLALSQRERGQILSGKRYAETSSFTFAFICVCLRIKKFPPRTNRNTHRRLLRFFFVDFRGVLAPFTSPGSRGLVCGASALSASSKSTLRSSRLTRTTFTVMRSASR